MNKHTPGPWINNKGSGWIWATGPDGVKDQIICQFWDNQEDDFENWQQNAALIAAAPEMYEALKAIYADWKAHELAFKNGKTQALVWVALDRAGFDGDL